MASLVYRLTELMFRRLAKPAMAKAAMDPE